jgi:predicted GNAT family acetyltransferase
MEKRMADRIAEGRYWVLVKSGHVIFKADIVSLTPLAAFVEGVYVCPEQRGKEYGVRCMTQLARNLLAHVSTICLIVNEENQPARALYERAGYRLRSRYATAYFSAI